LIKIMSSGMDRSIRAKRESRRSRNSLRMERPPMPPPPPVSRHSSTTVITQVSATIMDTRQESKTNHASLRQFLFPANELKRTYHSKKKYQQKAWSAIWNIGAASRSVVAELLSVSMAIQSALMEITTNVRFSKTGCVAIVLQIPVL